MTEKQAKYEDKPKIVVKMVEWFDQHFYKIEYDKIIEGREPEPVTVYIPSVTTKLGIIDKPFLAQWRGDIGNREADARMIESQDRGSRIHHAWETYTQGGAVIFNDYKRPAYSQQEIIDIESKFKSVCILRNQGEMYEMTKLQKFLDAIKPTQTHSEMTVYDIDNMDAGTVDNLFEIPEGDYLINGTKPVHLIAGWYVFDLKTGNQIGQARKQVSAYVKCVQSMGFCNPIGAIIGHTSAKTKGGIAGFSATVLLTDEIEQEYKGYRLTADLWQIESGDKEPKVFELPTILFKEGLTNDAAKK